MLIKRKTQSECFLQQAPLPWIHSNKEQQFPSAALLLQQAISLQSSLSSSPSSPSSPW